VIFFSKEQNAKARHHSDHPTMGDVKVLNESDLQEHEHSSTNEKLGVPFAVESVALVRHLPL
jgi:hypothetical protein